MRIDTLALLVGTPVTYGRCWPGFKSMVMQEHTSFRRFGALTGGTQFGSVFEAGTSGE